VYRKHRGQGPDPFNRPAAVPRKKKHAGKHATRISRDGNRFRERRHSERRHTGRGSQTGPGYVGKGYLGVGLLVGAGEVVLVEVLGVEEGGAGVVGEAGRRGNHLLLLLVLPLLPRDLRLLRLHTHKPACTVITLTLPRQQ
jgi:hypothetical protein